MVAEGVISNGGDDMNSIHPTHRMRSSDASTYDAVCESCGAVDATPATRASDRALRSPCKKPRHKLSKRATRLIAEYAGAVSDHREWNNQHNVDRAFEELTAYVAELERVAKHGRVNEAVTP